MELKKEELMKRRGYIATMEASYHFLADNFKTIFKYLWPYFLVASVLFGVYFIMNINTSMKMMSDPTDIADPLTTLALLPLLFVAYLIIYGKQLTLYNDKSAGWNTVRTFKLTLWLILITLVLGIIFVAVMFLGGGFGAGLSETDPTSFGKTVLVGFVAILISLVLLLPYTYVYVKYLVDTKTHFRSLIFKGWLTGMRHWGYIFITTLLLSLCMGVIGIIIYIPLYICGMAFYMSTSGVAQGDASGVPSYFTILVFLVIVLTYFVYLFISIYSFTVYYYMYGNIETYEAEKGRLTLPEESSADEVTAIESIADETTENTVY